MGDAGPADPTPDPAADPTADSTADSTTDSTTETGHPGQVATGSNGGPDAFEVFRPRRARIVATSMGIASIVVFVGLAVLMPVDAGLTQWGPADRIMLGSIGVVIAGVFYRYASIRATPTQAGLVVRNLFTSRSLDWPELIGVQYNDGDPWPTLDLADTDQLAVMAIQRADGPRAMAEAQRLATLIDALGTSAPAR